ncbi:hypothetical protein N7462_006140 [Penicillium macrosclerotiorum]|uniref:uncharacterized protein n=1 Tax=Penicillium macrosclerotiorum TaxID=303699 RepID=UPI0025494225|nr:uncharacterized protein N7462_006140 [Penicillium macrosclerotiorum]KAJ5682975.1 hypothetical protein N7462_006140 [Penicillium macrosclerotiorum]
MASRVPRKVRRRKKPVRTRDDRVRKPSARDSIFGSQWTRPTKPPQTRHKKKSSKPKVPPSDDLLEDNVFERTPLPQDYVFVPKGDVYITRKCRVMTKESNKTVYLVYDNAGKRKLGIRVPRNIHADVLAMAAKTADSRATAVQARDTKFMARGREVLREQFPLMPEDTLEVVLSHAFLKGSGRVGRTALETDERKAELAVEAHIRHTLTPYDSMLEGGQERLHARRKVWDTVNAIKKAWQGTGQRKDECLTLRIA